MRFWKAPLAALAAASMLTAGATASLADGRTDGKADGRADGGAQRATAGHAVPWNRVGPGWVLTQYTTAKPEGQGRGPQTLYLISPGGTRYQLAWWPDSQGAPQLLAWSPDGTRALFSVFSAHPRVEQITLATGKVTTFTLPGDASPIGYTAPAGLNIVASRVTGDAQSLARYDLTGRLVRSLGTSVDGQVLYAPDGRALVTGETRGLALIGNNGALIRNLPLPGTGDRSCNPVRWWDASTILATCGQPSPNQPANRLWLVPVGGQRPTALTPPRPASSRDLGDIDAWRLSTGLYLQGAGPCGVLYIFRQAGNGSISLVHVPQAVGDDSHVLTASGRRLLVQAPTSCTGSNSLFWFDPAAHAEQWLIKAPGNVMGVTMAIPFYSRDNVTS